MWLNLGLASWKFTKTCRDFLEDILKESDTPDEFGGGQSTMNAEISKLAKIVCLNDKIR